MPTPVYKYVDALALLCRDSQGLDQGQPLQAQDGLLQGEDGFQCGVSGLVTIHSMPSKARSPCPLFSIQSSLQDCACAATLESGRSDRYHPQSGQSLLV